MVNILKICYNILTIHLINFKKYGFTSFDMQVLKKTMKNTKFVECAIIFLINKLKNLESHHFWYAYQHHFKLLTIIHQNVGKTPYFSVKFNDVTKFW